MILTDNINILKELIPELWDGLKQYEDEKNRILFQIKETRRGDKTLSINKDNKENYLHSKYDPIREANTILESYEDMDDDFGIIFYGTGLGYHIKLVLEKYRNIRYYIYEPIPELMYNFLSNINLRDLSKSKLMGISIGRDNNIEGLSRFVDLNKDKLKIIELPSHKQNFPDEFNKFNEIFLELIRSKRTQLVTNYSFQKRWIINSMKNFNEVLSTPNILIEKKGEFKGKTAILVAAGPSLNEEIENIRYIKENGLAHIFSVGSAINTLIYHNIYPDAACTYDPAFENQMVFEIIKEKCIKEIPMIFGSSVGYETRENYPGDKYHMITSQDTVSSYYLKNEDDRVINIVQDAPSIAVVTIQILYELGFSRILLVGQNLGYRGKEQYSKGISYGSDLTEEELEKGIKVKDVYGNEILTNEGFNFMRQQIEHYIKQLPNIKVINTTKGGAHVEGADFIELKEVIDNCLKEKIVEDNWLDGNKTIYDKEYLDFKSKNMDKAYSRVSKINKEYKDILNKIERAINNRNFSQAEKLYIKLDKELIKIENNDYYKTFILPMNRVQYKILVDSIDILNYIRDPYEKGRKIVESFRNFIDICTEDMQMIEPIYKEMKEVISNYTKSSLEKGE
ncbi:6-hydroxymethylpterin diphosphokinase MptE-like protein [Tissierella sp.]|uniref:motility associated factor glycosyltransferase family protein n=1 Tax=Tissierella sp. TaxID=41274 RepID=UPI0028AC1F2E|nr:6-hydroxymethylpterin diphosphokinase MptE-like protein [Tissierella sp.]